MKSLISFPLPELKFSFEKLVPRLSCVCAVLGAITPTARLHSDSVFFNSGAPDGKLGTASRIAGNGLIEVESADDFLLGQAASISGASFTGLIPSGLSLGAIQQVNVEIYRVFPNDSTVPPSGNVPTRNNSPSDVALDTRESAAGTLSYSATLLDGSFSVLNSVVNGIHPKPNNVTLGEGPVRGQEVKLDVSFSTPITLSPDHYFFVPQVELSDGSFLWLSAAKPISGAGTTPFLPDLQSWIRDANLDPDWLRLGADIISAGAFNASFTLTGTLPEGGSTAMLFGFGICSTALARWVSAKRERR